MEKNKRKDIINAAMDAFLEHGYRKTSMNNIALLAQVSKRTLYKYFNNKEEIYLTIINEILDIIDQKDKDLELYTDLPFIEQLRRHTHSIIDEILKPETQKLARILISEQLKDEPIYKEDVNKLFETRAKIIKWIETQQKLNHISKEFNASDIKKHLDSLIDGFILFPLIFKEVDSFSKKEIMRIKNLIVNIFVNSYCSTKIKNSAKNQP